MLTPEYLDVVADPVVEIYSKLQEEILADIVRRITKMDYITPTAEWQITKLQESGMLLKDIQTRIQKTMGLSATELQELFEQATIENLSGHFKSADIITLLKRDTKYYKTILAGLEKTQGSLKNFTMSTAESYQKLFFEVTDDAYQMVNSGAFDYNTAINKATDTLLKDSQTVVTYPSGWADSVEVAVRRAVLTGINQTQAQIQVDLAEELNLDYVDVSAHMGARPDHAVWQGKRYCISGKDKKYPKFEDATGYGTGAGLCGWNCRHTFFPTTADAPEYYSDKELQELLNAKVKYNGQDIGYYDATQVMREYESSCRNLRKELVAINELPDSDQKTMRFERKSAMLKQREAQYKDFCQQTGLLPQSERMRAYGYNRSLSAKVGRASKEYLEGHKKIEPLKVSSQPKPKAVKPAKQMSLLDMVASCNSAQEVEDFMNAQNWFDTTKVDYRAVDMRGLDTESAKSVARAYVTVFERYPQFIGKFSTFYGEDLAKGTYASCRMGTGRVRANRYFYSNYQLLKNGFIHDVDVNWHPANTDVDSVIIHEIGHAIDGYLSALVRRHKTTVKMSNTYLSSYMRPKVAKECGMRVADIGKAVSRYATKDAQEWFAECFCEYINSPTPREMALEFQKMLEEIIEGADFN